MTAYELSTQVSFHHKRHAEIAYDVLRVDSELKRCSVTKTLTLNDNKLTINLKSSELKSLRVSVGTVFDHLILANQTIKNFGPAVSDEYSY